MNQVQSLRKQSAWLMTAKVIAFTFSFALPLLVVRYLAQEVVGNYRQAFLLITNAVAILPLGFSMSAYYFLARETERRSAAVLNILVFNFCAGGLAFLVLALFPQLLGSIFSTEVLSGLAPKIGMVVWIWIFSTFLEVVALANQEARLATAFIVLASVSKATLMSVAVLAFGTIEALLWAAIIQGVIQTAILFNYLRSRFPGYWREFNGPFFRQQLVYAIPYGFAGVLWIAQTDIHNYFVSHKFSSADFAVYAYGCFEVPLIAMLTESVTSVLIPRMSALQLAGDREEMIRLLARAMQKLALFFFPIYAFLLITAHTFITTLFTDAYAASVPIFLINITLLPAGVIINDPVVRAYPELGRRFLLVRIFVLAALITSLYVALDSVSMIGMITIAVAAILSEKFIASTLVAYKLGLSRKHLGQFTGVAKTALITATTAGVTFLFYSNTHDSLLTIGRDLGTSLFSEGHASLISLLSGSFVLIPAGAIFSTAYILGAVICGLIDDEEKRALKALLERYLSRRVSAAVLSQPQN